MSNGNEPAYPTREMRDRNGEVEQADALILELAKPSRDPSTLTDAELDAAIADIDREEDELAKRADVLRGIRANRAAEKLLDSAIGFDSESLNNLAIRTK